MTNENAEIAAFVITWLLTGFILFGYSAIQIYRKKHSDWTDTMLLVIWVAINAALLVVLLFFVVANGIYYLLT